MDIRGTDFSEARVGGTRKRVKLLAVVPSGSEELGLALERLLKPVQNIELVSTNLPDNITAASEALSGLIRKHPQRPLLLCLEREMIASCDRLFEAAHQQHANLFILVILSGAAPEQLQRLAYLGATDFCLAPLRLDDLLARIMRWSSLQSKNSALTERLEAKFGLQQFLGESRIFLEAINKIPKLARCDANVFITGETGTGKEMCARAVHQLGRRGDHPFVPVNCGAIPAELVENELFGHDAGAFTSAGSAVRGLVHEAEGGTLFLDEIDSLPLQTQVKFLRFLQDQEYRPLGARKSVRADIRVIAASNADIAEIVRCGRLRADLYYRLNVLPLHLPPLRERREDIPVLAHHFVANCAREFSAPAKELSRAALEKLVTHQWPGNVRELENIIARAFVMSERPLILAEDICLPMRKPTTDEMSFKVLKQRAVAEFEAGYIRQLLEAHAGNISKAARAAKKNRRAFWELMRKHEIAATTASAAHRM